MRAQSWDSGAQWESGRESTVPKGMDMAVLVSPGATTNTIDWVAHSVDIYFSQFWRMEVQDQGADRFVGVW